MPWVTTQKPSKSKELSARVLPPSYLVVVMCIDPMICRLASAVLAPSGVLHLGMVTVPVSC